MIRTLALTIALAVAMGSVCQGATPKKSEQKSEHPHPVAPKADGDPHVFADIVGRDAPLCVATKSILALPGVAEIDLTHDQWQFLRGLFVAMPPVSRALPAGDKAVMFGDANSGAIIVALVDDQQSCARFLVPDFVQDMLKDVGDGRIIHSGDKT